MVLITPSTQGENANARNLGCLLSRCRKRCGEQRAADGARERTSIRH
jgi:hypothetical protein